MSTPPPDGDPFPGCVELASARVGGRALLASDEFFAPKENLLKPGRGIFIPEKFTSRGKWMDGWESRRKRGPGHDWCIIRLGIPGSLRGVDIDTNHFLGNHPPFASLDACSAPAKALGKALSSAETAWTPVLAKTRLLPGSRNIFPIDGERVFTHVRLNAYPDGGIARLRVYGRGAPKLAPGRETDLASILNGACVLACNDMFFGIKDNLIMPGRAKNMGDGWETKRKRVPGHDWVIVRLGAAGTLRKVEIDTNHFKGNYPDRASLEGALTREDISGADQADRAAWTEILPETKLKAHHRHFFSSELRARGPFNTVRLNIFPDGGVSRLRVHAIPEPI